MSFPSLSFALSPRLTLPLLLLIAVGCRCDGGTVGQGEPEFQVNPAALAFETCPQQDSAGSPIADVYPDQRTFTLTNVGTVPGPVQLSVSGAQASAFSFVDTDVPAELSASGSVEIPVLFAPAQSGAARATLTVDDGNAETEPVTVTLDGTGRDLPSSPTLAVAYEEGTGFMDCDELSVCSLRFPDTFFGQSAQRKIRIRNNGCPALKVTGIELQPLGGGAGAVDYGIDQPSVLPTTSTPTVLTTTGGNNELEVTLRFSPEETLDNNLQRYAVLTVRTNDPARAEFQVQLLGNGAAPAIYVTPTFCNFSESADLCGNATKVPNQARLLVKNSGSVQVTLSSAVLEKGGQGRFSLATNPTGTMLAPGGDVLVDVAYTEGNVFLTERLVISATANGNPAGDAVVTLAGGIPPVLTTNPDIQLDFSGATAVETTKTVLIQNAAGAGTLVLNNVYVDPSPFFSLVMQVTPGTELAGGASLPVEILYKKPSQGGIQSGALHIDSNDTSYGPPNYKTVNLFSEAPLDQIPVPVIKGCLPSDTTCADGRENIFSVKLSDLGTPKQVLIYGKDSYDPNNDATTKPVAEYYFRLEKIPANATAALVSLENDKVRTTDGDVLLTLDPTAGGEYRVTLRVYDDAVPSQASAGTALLRIVVQ